ncbi:WYL domain-containing protein [Sediminicoccus sp. BL-A-41-H5]|uniref:WYL domain-containing protein n=1 Tax=Sediminicoccus sp. BL-A-41-H5 TaxID=3421106 RepID=UPI003D66F427
MIGSESVPSRPPDLRWSQEARLRAIDLAAFWEGRVNRAALIRRFGISVPQATNDLRDYQARAPGNLRYDTREKTYLAGPDFRPLFGEPSAEAWLRDAEARHGLPVEIMPLPARRLDPWLLRRLAEAQREGQALHVLYQPMNLPEPAWRWISPVAFASDGLRWHLRAWNHGAGRHEHLLFPRMLELGEARAAGPLPEDPDWERRFAVRLRPASRLNAAQQRVVAADYGMEGGEAVVEVRVALLFLFRRRLGLDRGDGLVEVANAAEMAAVMAGADARFNGGGEG